tara:strand:+ start:651 stop:1151 length:501 start_codon:yes stop_codon:yes gene_type:complete
MEKMKLYEPFDFLTTEECDEIIKYAENLEFIDGVSFGKPGIRKNRVIWYNNSDSWQSWIDTFNTIEPVVEWIEPPQIAFYKPGEVYHWHIDSLPNRRTHIRHFTLVCELQSAPNSGLELRDKQFKLQKGQAIIFRSSDEHRATSPSSDERISLTIWARAKNKDIVG